jgi:hypothetical protein
MLTLSKLSEYGRENTVFVIVFNRVGELYRFRYRFYDRNYERNYDRHGNSNGNAVGKGNGNDDVRSCNGVTKFVTSRHDSNVLHVM